MIATPIDEQKDDNRNMADCIRFSRIHKWSGGRTVPVYAGSAEYHS